MYAFCTYGSKAKSEAPGEIPALERYSSQRLQRVYRAARELNLDFVILSGEQGLIMSDQSLPWYDHPLQQGEVIALVPRVVEQLARLNITRLVYFTRSLARVPEIAPYHATIVEACNRAGVPIFVIEIDEPPPAKHRPA